MSLGPTTLHNKTRFASGTTSKGLKSWDRRSCEGKRKIPEKSKLYSVVGSTFYQVRRKKIYPKNTCLQKAEEVTKRD